MSSNRQTLRIALTADLHYGITRPKTIVLLAERIAAEGCDVVLIAGDIGEPDSNFRDALALFEHLTIPCALVAGNHDLWAGDYSSHYLWNDVLPYLTRKSGFTWLDGENVILGRLGICGTIGWYDYSAKDPHLTNYDDERYAVEKGKFNYDALKIDWPISDQEFAAEVLAAFRERVTELQHNRQVEKIVVLTHVPPFEEQIIRKAPEEFLWNVNNAYFGNLTLGREILPHDKVHLVVSGHTHVAVDVRIPRRSLTGDPLRVLTVGSQYYRPRLEVVDLSI